MVINSIQQAKDVQNGNSNLKESNDTIASLNYPEVKTFTNPEFVKALTDAIVYLNYKDKK